MRIGIFADAHDHVDNVRRAVVEFNRAGCELVVFAGDFCSPIVVPPLRKLNCPVLACFGDNDGNRTGIEGGMRIIGEIGEPPFGFQTPDGVRILVTHVPQHVRGLIEGSHVVIHAHSHRAGIERDATGRLLINPGETGGWTYRKPSIALLDTQPLGARLVFLPEPPPIPQEFIDS
ncbi:MAG TPA: YfcE family phosphodiesterase [Planctomycetaceae bacterium]|nr:YfcE family phosphodiesterase [Planctomycetaceae bacterium]